MAKQKGRTGKTNNPFNSPDLKTERQLNKERDAQQGNRGFLDQLSRIDRARQKTREYETKHRQAHTYQAQQESITAKRERHRETRLDIEKRDPTEETHEPNTGFCDQVNFRHMIKGNN